MTFRHGRAVATHSSEGLRQLQEVVTQEWRLVCLAHNLLKLAKAITW